MSAPTERELLAFADELARYRRLSAPQALRAELRASLLAAPFVPTSRPAFGRLRAPALRPIVAGTLVLALLVAGGGSAAASSLPGDPAFGLKRAVEEVQVALAPDEVARLDTLLTQSDRRIGELETAASQRPAAVAPATDEYFAAVGRVEAALARVAALPATVARDAAIARVSAVSVAHIAALQALAARLPAAAQHGIQRAIEAQQAVHGRSDNVPGPRVPPSAAPGRPSELPVGTPPGRGGPPSGVPGRP